MKKSINVNKFKKIAEKKMHDYKFRLTIAKDLFHKGLKFIISDQFSFILECALIIIPTFLIFDFKSNLFQEINNQRAYILLFNDNHFYIELFKFLLLTYIILKIWKLTKSIKLAGIITGIIISIFLLVPILYPKETNKILPQNSILSATFGDEDKINILGINDNAEIVIYGPLTNLGYFEYEPDTGPATWANMPVTVESDKGTEMSYTARIDHNNILTIYSESSGANGIQNKQVKIFGNLSIENDKSTCLIINDNNGKKRYLIFDGQSESFVIANRESCFVE